MITGSITGLFATTVGGVPKPRVDSIEVTTQGIRNEIIRDKKHHGGEQKAVCLLTNPIIKELQSTGHPISGGSTGENILLDVSPDLLQPGVQLQFSTVALEITMPAPPCKTISDSFTDGEFNLLSHKKYPGQTRWYARVLTEGTIHQSETYSINSIA
jgi:MOSC domain-containing protein YiiM